LSRSGRQTFVDFVGLDTAVAGEDSRWQLRLEALPPVVTACAAGNQQGKRNNDNSRPSQSPTNWGGNRQMVSDRNGNLMRSLAEQVGLIALDLLLQRFFGRRNQDKLRCRSLTAPYFVRKTGAEHYAKSKG
jgi:hypothetical protein